MGPHHLVDAVRAQARMLDRILPDLPSGHVREQLLALACQYNELAGWLYQDAGDPESAMVFSDRAMDAALALDNRSSTVYLLMRKTNIASDLGRADRASAIAEAAVRLMGSVTPQMRAVVLSQQGRAHALRGAATDSARSLEAAMREVERHHGEPDPLASYATPQYVAMEAAAGWAALGKPHLAIPIFENALAAWPTAQRRDLGVCQARLASAYADRGDTEGSVQVAKRAITTVRAATSSRALRELAGLRTKLAPWRREPEVAELSAMIKGLGRIV